MKLNILLGTNTVLGGYLNFAPPTDKPQTGVEYGNINNITSVDNGEAEEIRLEHVLSCLPRSKVTEFLQHVLGKLAIGGHIIIIDNEIDIIAQLYSKTVMNEDDFNALVFDTPSGMARQCGLTIATMSKFLEGCKLKIIKKRIDNNITFTLEAVREH